MIRLDAPDPLQTTTLQAAARVGDVDTIHKLLKKGHRPDCIDNRGWTAMHEAAAAGHLPCLVLFLRIGRCDKNARTHEGETPLYLSVYPNCKMDIMRLLINQGVNMNLGNNEDVTPLHKACQLDLLDCAEVLLESGANIDAADAEGTRPIQDAIYKKHTRMVDMLLHYGADLGAKTTYGITPLMSAAIVGYHEIIQKLDSERWNVINERDVTGRTALMLAAQKGCLKTVSILLEMGADANIVSEDMEQTALHLAAHGDDPRLVECLVKVTDVNKVIPQTKISPIILAVDSMQIESIKLLLAWMGDNRRMMSMVIDCQDEPLSHMYRQIGTMAYLLHYKAECEGALAILELLLKYGFPVDPIGVNEVPPIAATAASKAPKTRRRAILEILIHHGANADLPCPMGRLRSLPACIFYSLTLHPYDMWQVRMLLAACKKCDTNTFLRIVLTECLSREEQRSPWELLQLLVDVAIEIGISDQDVMSQVRRVCTRMPDYKTAKQRDLSALESCLVPFYCTVFRLSAQRAAGLGADGALYLRPEPITDKIVVPEELTPSPLSSICRLIVRRHYSQTDLKKYNLPNIVIDFLNYCN